MKHRPLVRLAIRLLGEAARRSDPYTEDVELGRPFKWIRWGGALVGVALGLSSQVQLIYEPGGLKQPYWTISLILHAVILGLFLLNTRDFPARRSWHAPVLAAQMFLAIPLTSDFWVLNALSIPLVRPPAGRWRWLAAQTAAVPMSLAFLLWRQWAVLVPVANREKLWTQLYFQLGLGLLEGIAWMLLAYAAALLIVQMERDRRRLISVNAELTSSRSMLAESSRVAERVELARELHDSIGHHLTTLNLELELAQRVPSGERDGHVR
jgi:signal transduction histidine kinase